MAVPDIAQDNILDSPAAACDCGRCGKYFGHAFDQQETVVQDRTPWEQDAMHSECGQTFFETARLHAHEAICGYCIAENRRKSK